MTTHAHAPAQRKNGRNPADSSGQLSAKRYRGIAIGEPRRQRVELYIRAFPGQSMDDIAVARPIHVVSIVHWIGGVSPVTVIILPAISRFSEP
jgi:hypothetical protein